MNKENCSALAIIPARYASSRLPGKPLANIQGKSMLQRVYEQSRKSTSLSLVYIATDDERIVAHVEDFGGKCVLTSTEHQSGTERCVEALNLIQKNDRSNCYPKSWLQIRH